MSIVVVMLKEILDNWRDRQTVFYALLFGPILLPLLIGGALVTSLQQVTIDFEEVSTLAVDGLPRAPNLMQFLHGHNVDTVAAPAGFEDALAAGDLELVLQVPDAYASALRAGQPAPLTVFSNTADKDSARAARRIVALLSAYERTLDTLRLQHRGIDPSTFDSLDIHQTDVSEDGATGQMFASLLPFLFIMSMVLGGFYLAIDTTAGERERQSLEPLLSLPLSRRALVLGKFGATLCFVTLSAVLTALSIYLLFRFVPDELLGGALRFDAAAIGVALLLISPLLPFITAMLVTVSASTRSTKEAQTYLGLLMVIPMAPFFVLQFVNLGGNAATYLLPMLSQYRLLENVVLDRNILASHVAMSFVGTLVGAALLLLLTFRLYQRETILG